MVMAVRQIGNPRSGAAGRKFLQPLLRVGKIAQGCKHRVRVEMNNGTSVNSFCLLIHPHFMQGKRRKEKQPPGAHGVVTVIDNGDAKSFFYIQNLQTLMPVMITHGIGKQTAE